MESEKTTNQVLDQITEMDSDQQPTSIPGTKIIGIKFKDQGLVYHYDPQDFFVYVGDYVIVETENGEDVGKVASQPRYSLKILNNKPLKKVLRLPDDKDLSRLKQHEEIEKSAYVYGLERIKERDLSMKLINVEYAFDDSKMVFYFSAENRVDFRELVKDLAYKYKARIELKQVGIRDGARMIDGFGVCGRPLCCSTFLMEFAPVSIRMARKQEMVINPAKISGMCGRLMCCIAYEHGNEDEKK